MAIGQTLIVGAVANGGTRNVLVRAAGPALAAFGLAGMADPRLELFDGAGVLASANDNWPAALGDFFPRLGAFGFSSGSRDAALSQAITGGVTVQTRGTGAGVVLVEVYATDLVLPLVEASGDVRETRYQRSNAAPTLPSAVPYPPPGWTISPPSGNQILWSVQALVRSDRTGLASGSSWGDLTRDPPVSGNLPLALPSGRLVNLSARNRVGTGADILIAGFALSGLGTKQLLIRAAGPALAGFGVSGALPDPRLEVFDAAGRSLATNDNWGVSTGAGSAVSSSSFAQVGAFPFSAGSRDAALLITLNAGATYTVQVSGVGNSTGEALVEIYEVF
jgi:hypothetical protein